MEPPSNASSALTLFILVLCMYEYGMSLSLSDSIHRHQHASLYLLVDAVVFELQSSHGFIMRQVLL